MTLPQAQSRSFGEQAVELASLAASLLAWRPDEFWNSTPDELATALGLAGQLPNAMDGDELKHLRSLFPDKREN